MEQNKYKWGERKIVIDRERENRFWEWGQNPNRDIVGSQVVLKYFNMEID